MTVDNDDGTWMPAVLRGDFGAIPRAFCWNTSAEFAHLLDGYRILGGVSSALSRSERMLCEIAATGEVKASALELWAALFVQHRGYRMSGYGPDARSEARLDKMCCVLRARLMQATPHEKIRVLTAVAAAQAPLGGSPWRS